MKRLEDNLKTALRRREPPEGFAERVLSRVAEQWNRPSRWERLVASFRIPQLRWAPALVVLLVLITGFEYVRQRRIRAEGEQAKRQVLLALEITARQLRFVEKSIQKVSPIRLAPERKNQ